MLKNKYIIISGLIIFSVLLILFITPLLSNFMLEKPSAEIDKIENDVVLGDEFVITGSVNNLNDRNITIEITDNIGQSYMKNKVLVQNGKFKTKFDTINLKTGLFNVIVKRDYIINNEDISEKNDSKILDILTIRIVDPNIDNLIIKPATFTYGNSPKAIVILKNTENYEINFHINLLVDGYLIHSKTVQIKPNNFENVEFIIEEPSVGEHKVSVGGREASFKVLPTPYLQLDQINRKIGIGDSLKITGFSNEPDGTNVLLTIQSNGDILAQQNTEIKNTRFSILIDTTHAKETIYTVNAKTQNEVSESIEVAFIKLLSTFEITDFSLSESTVIVGTPITGTATVKNSGNIGGSKEFILYLDGFEKDRQTITIEPNELKRVTFSINEDVGVHEARIESFTKEFTIRPTPTIILDIISDTRIGDKLVVNGKTNMPDGTSILLTANADSSSLAPQTAISMDGKFSVTFDTNSANEGLYKINAKSVSGTSSDIISTLLYNTEPSVSISLGVSQKEIIVGQSAKVIVTLTTTSSSPISRNLELKMDGIPLETRTVNVHNMKTEEFTIPNPPIGIHIIDVNGYQTQFQVASIPSSGDIGFQLRTDKNVVMVGEEVPLTLSAMNIITKPPMTFQLILTIPTGMSVTSTEFSKSGAGQYSSIEYDVEPGETRYIGARVKPNQEGTYKIEGRIVYYFAGEETNKKDEVIPLYVKVNEEEDQEQIAKKPDIPGFSLFMSMFTLLFTAIQVIRKKKR